MADDRKLERTKTPGVYKRGDSYVCRWRHRGQSHKRYFATYGEAREFKRTLHGSGKQPTTKQTVLDYYEKWIDSYRGRTARGLEDTTRDEYRRSFRLHVLPFPLAREKLRDVTSRDVSDWFGDLEAKGVHPPSIRKAKAALSAMLATAAQAGGHCGQPGGRCPVRAHECPAEAPAPDADRGGRVWAGRPGHRLPRIQEGVRVDAAAEGGQVAQTSAGLARP